MTEQKEDLELVSAECYACGNFVGHTLIHWRRKAPIVLKSSGWIVCKACGARWRP